MKKILAIISLGAVLTAWGCATGKTESPRAARAAQDQQIYEVYRQYLEATNQQRQQAGLPPEPVKSFEEFRRSPGAY